MKSLLRVVVTAVLALSPCLLSQELSGTWQGTLQVPRGTLRIVMKISKGDRGELKVVMYSIDEGPGGNASSSASLQDLNLKVTFPGNRAVYEGRLSADGRSIMGTWSQGQPLPLTLMLATAETAWAIPDPVPAIKPMAPEANPTFEVVTVRPSKPDDERAPMIQTQPRRWSAINRTVMELITYSYSLHPGQIVNAPSWLDERYDITAQPDGEGQPNQRQWQAMVRKLLADRFKLTVHAENRNMPAYVLTGKNASKLAPSTGDASGPPNLAMRAQGRFAARNATMGDLASELGAVLDRPVVDRTGIPERYDFNIIWTPDDFQLARLSRFPVPRGSNGDIPNLFTALKEQLGFTLEAARVPIDVLVIEHIEKPSQN
ncbi:MAG TPA: TIGR03435 family protein [Bryobacteraceae bacterium]|jgi:uncharacterized protein (TIGR03435 family)|nr:TIGR03435 family protein [Bryobacteraceae bacterium]